MEQHFLFQVFSAFCKDFVRRVVAKIFGLLIIIVQISSSTLDLYQNNKFIMQKPVLARVFAFVFKDFVKDASAPEDRFFVK